MSNSTTPFTAPLSIQRKCNLRTSTIIKSRFGGSKKATSGKLKLTQSKMSKFGRSLGTDVAPGTDLAPANLNRFDIKKM